MRAIILNSGQGSRLEHLTQDLPKCLVEIRKNQTILSHQLNLLKNQGIRDVLVTTGPFENQIRQHVFEDFCDMNISFVHNSKYLATNYIYSMGKIPRDFIQEDILLMHGDLVFEEKVIRKVLSQQGNGVLMDLGREISPEDKDFKGRIVRNFVREISVNLIGKDSFPLMPLYRLEKKFFELWMDMIERLIEEGQVAIYAENALNLILEDLSLLPIDFHGLFCMEVDTLEDYDLCRRTFG